MLFRHVSTHIIHVVLFRHVSASFSKEHDVLDGVLSINSFRMIPGLSLDGFEVVGGSPRT